MVMEGVRLNLQSRTCSLCKDEDWIFSSQAGYFSHLRSRQHIAALQRAVGVPNRGEDDAVPAVKRRRVSERTGLRYMRFGRDDPKFQLDSEEGDDYESDLEPVGDGHTPQLDRVSDHFLYRIMEGPAARVSGSLTRNNLMFADLIADVGLTHSQAMKVAEFAGDRVSQVATKAAAAGLPRLPRPDTLNNEVTKLCDRAQDGDKEEFTYVVPERFRVPGVHTRELTHSDKRYQVVDVKSINGHARLVPESDHSIPGLRFWLDDTLPEVLRRD